MWPQHSVTPQGNNHWIHCYWQFGKHPFMGTNGILSILGRSHIIPLYQGLQCILRMLKVMPWNHTQSWRMNLLGGKNTVLKLEIILFNNSAAMSFMNASWTSHWTPENNRAKEMYLSVQWIVPESPQIQWLIFLRMGTIQTKHYKQCNLPWKHMPPFFSLYPKWLWRGKRTTWGPTKPSALPPF